MRRLLIALALLAGSAHGAELDERVDRLASQLRCLVCQNQTIADSTAPLAVQLKHEVRQQLASGRSEQDVADFMVQRYGDFVLYRPPFKPVTWLLWLGPALLLAVGLTVLFRQIRRQGDPDDEEVEESEMEQRA
ncbi:MAG: cytochrome c-type biogenesis protein CcmH [Gammaproteobacteria bacterium]